MTHTRGTFAALLALLCAWTRAPHGSSTTTVARKIPRPPAALDAGARPDRSTKAIAADRARAIEIAQEVASARGTVFDDPPEHATADFRDPATLAKAGLAAVGREALLPVLSRGSAGKGAIVLSPCVPADVDVTGGRPPGGRHTLTEADVLDSRIQVYFTPAQRTAVSHISQVPLPAVWDDLGGDVTFCTWVRVAVTAPGGRAGRLLRVY